MAPGLDCPSIECNVPPIPISPIVNLSEMGERCQPIQEGQFISTQIFSLRERFRSSFSWIQKRIPAVTYPLPFYLLQLRSTPSPEPIRDYQQALKDRNPLAIALSPFVQSFERKEGPDPKILVSELEALVQKPEFVRLIRPYFQEGTPYGRTQFLIDLNLGNGENGEKLGLEGVAVLWKPGQKSGIHHHGNSQGVDVVVAGRGGVEVRYVKVGKEERLVPYAVIHLSPHQANQIKGKLIHEVKNQSDVGENLLTIHFYWPPIRK